MILAPEACGCNIIEGASLVNSPICSGVILFMALLEGYIWGRCNISTPCKRVEPARKVRYVYDFIVVGGGTAGSIVAARLSENTSFQVLLLEAGGPEPVGTRLPSLYRTFWSKEGVDWMYRTEADNYCLDQDGQGCSWPRGKALGGTALLNGMMYHRGHAADYEDWVKEGAEGWSWQDNLDYFDKMENNLQIGTVVSANYHSSSGPMPVNQFNYQPPFLYELLSAINETGLPIIQDMNDPNTPEGFNIAQAFNKDGQRYTTARAYLSQKTNLHVALNTFVSKVLIDPYFDKNETRAIGVEYYDEHQNLRTVYAIKEVILSAGALNTPQILMLSGIGPKETLEQFDIPLVADLPVGQNLRNHLGITLYYNLTKLENTRDLDRSVLTEYLLNGQGPVSATGITQLTGLLYSSLGDRERNQTDLQFFFNGFYAECSQSGEVGEKVCQYSGKNISVNGVALLPRSVGNVTLRSANPFDPPLFYPNYFSHPDDMVMIKDAARYLQKIFDTTIMKEKYGIVMDPSTTVPCNKEEMWSDAWIECMARVHTDPQNHQAGTAAIGKVIDPYLRVYGIDNLRVIDASSMPMAPTGNPQAAIMMVAERGASFIMNTGHDV